MSAAPKPSRPSAIVELRPPLRVVPLDGLPGGLAGAALVDAGGVEVERRAAPAARFDADRAFLALDARRQTIDAHLERLREALERGPRRTAAAAALTLGWRARDPLLHLVPLAFGYLHATAVMRIGPESFGVVGGLELLLVIFSLIAAFDAWEKPGMAALRWEGVLALLLFFAMLLFEGAGARRWPGAYDAGSFVLLALLGATLAQAALALWLGSRRAPLPGLRLDDRSDAPAAAGPAAILCLAPHNGVPIPSLAVKYRAADGTDAFTATLPLKRIDRAPHAAVDALAHRALAHAHREQADALAAAAAHRRLHALEDSARTLDGG